MFDVPETRMHHRVYNGVLAALAAMSVAGVLPAFAQEQTALGRRGESLVATHCSRCHSTGRTGASTRTHRRFERYQGGILLRSWARHWPKASLSAILICLNLSSIPMKSRRSSPT